MPPYWPEEKYCTFKAWQLQQLLTFQRQILLRSLGLTVCHKAEDHTINTDYGKRSICKHYQNL